MRKMMLACTVALMSACGGGGFDKKACTDAETSVKKAYNDCVANSGNSITFSCDTYDANASAYKNCDFTAYYTAWKDYVKCENMMLKLGTTTPSLKCN